MFTIPGWVPPRVTHRIGTVALFVCCLAVASSAAAAPSLTLTTSATSPTGSTSVSYALASSENLSGVTASDFSNAGTSTCDTPTVSGRNKDWIVSFSGCSGGTVVPVLAADSVTGSSGSGPGSNLSGPSVTIDTAGPTVTKVEARSPNSAFKAGDSVLVDVTFSEPVIVTDGTTKSGGTTTTLPPTLDLSTGNSSNGVATENAVSGSVVTFAYTVRSGDATSDLNYVSTASLTLPGSTTAATITDSAGNAATVTLPAADSATALAGTSSVMLDTVVPTQVISFTSNSPASSAVLSGSTVFYRGAAAGTFNLRSTVSDDGSGAGSVTFPALGGSTTGWTHTAATPSSAPFEGTYAWGTSTTSSPTAAITPRDRAGNAGTTATLTFTNDATGPTGGAIRVNGSASQTYRASGTVPLVVTGYSADAGAGLAASPNTIMRRKASWNGISCGTFSDDAATTVSGGNDSASLGDGCFRYVFTGTDRVGNTSSVTSAIVVVDTAAPTAVLDSAPGPDSQSSITQADFSFSAANGETATFECKMDSGAWESCTSPKSYTGLGQGERTFALRATDLAGNASAEVSRSWSIDSIAPTVTLGTAPQNPTDSRSASISFSASETAAFECSLDAGPYDECTSPVGHEDLADGSHTVSVRPTDGFGNVGLPARVTWTVDTSAPAATITSGPSGTVTSASPSFQFSSDESGSTFQCALDGGAFLQCSSPRSHSGMAEGSHAFSVRAIDAAGNVGTATTRTWTIDTTAPVVTVTSSPPSRTTSTSASFTFATSEPGTIECRLDGKGAWSTCTTGYSTSGLAAGGHSLAMRATDSAGNTSATSAFTWDIDTTAPVLTLGGAPASPAPSSSATFTMSADESATFACTLDGTSVPCTGPSTTFSALADGSHTLSVVAVDDAGNRSAAQARVWTVDAVAPTAVITSAPASLVNSSTATFAFRSDKTATFTCRLDSGAWASCTSPHTRTAVADGTHTLSVRATSLSGVVSAIVSTTWTVDTTAPGIDVTDRPADPTGSTAATIAFSTSENATSMCSVDGAEAVACISPLNVTGLSDGSHTVAITATDEVGNTSAPTTVSWTVDTQSPTTTITSGPEGATSSTSASVAFTSNESGTFACRIDDGAFAPCTSPVSYSGLAAGTHTVAVTVTDEAGNAGPAATWTWVIDHTPPVITIASGPDEVSALTDATFEFSADEASTFRCRLDGKGPSASCSSGYSLTGLTEGPHSLVITATDQAGNSASMTFAWTVDTSVPDAEITEAPSTLSRSRSGAVAFQSRKAKTTFECSLNSGEWEACASPSALTGLADGAYTYDVRPVDAAGRRGTAARASWSVDATAPKVNLQRTPAAFTSSTAALVDFTSDDVAAGYECRLNGGDWAPCSGSKDWTNLPDGPHTASVRANDPAGNVSTVETTSWTVDTAPPSLALRDGTPAFNRGRTSFTVDATDINGIETTTCSLNGTAEGPCPADYEGIEGANTVEVRTTDKAGNSSTRRHNWIRDTIEPQLDITGGPQQLTNLTSAVFSHSASDINGIDVTECAVDDGPFGPCAAAYENIGEGDRTFRVRVIDKAGNGAIGARTWRVDTTAPEIEITGAPGDVVHSQNVRVTFAASDANGIGRQECRLTKDGVPGDWVSCDGVSDYADLEDGEYTTEVRVSDRAGNAFGQSRTFRVHRLSDLRVVSTGRTTIHVRITDQSGAEIQRGLCIHPPQPDASSAGQSECHYRSIPFDARVDLLVDPDKGWQFSGWDGNPAPNECRYQAGNRCSFNMNDPPEGAVMARWVKADVVSDGEAPVLGIRQMPDQPDPTNTDTIRFELVSSSVSFAAPDGLSALDTANASAMFDVVNGAITGISCPNPFGPYAVPYTCVITTKASGEGVVSVVPNDAFAVRGTNEVITGRDGVTIGDNEVTYDSVAPAVSLQQAADQADPSNAAAIAFTVTTSEPLAEGAPTTGWFSATNGTVTGVSCTDAGLGATTCEVIVTAAADGPVTVAPAEPLAFHADPAGNAPTAIDGADRTVSYNATRPVATWTTTPASPTNLGTLEYAVSFSKDVTGLTVDDIEIVLADGITTADGCQVSLPTATGSDPLTPLAGTPVSVIVTGCGNGELVIRIRDGAVADGWGNTTPATDATTVEIDRVVPDASWQAVDTQWTNGQAVSFRLTFTKATTGLTPADIRPIGTVSAATCGTPVITGPVGPAGAMAPVMGTTEVPASTPVTVTFPSCGEGVVSARLRKASVDSADDGRTRDRAANYGPVSDRTSGEMMIDRTPPVLTITSPSVRSTNSTAATMQFAVTDAASGVAGNSCKMDSPSTFRPDGGAAIPLAADTLHPCSATAAFADLPLGQRTFTLTATDRAGNRSDLPRSWLIDQSAPVVTPGPGPPPISQDPEVTITWGYESGSTNACSFNNAQSVSCASPYVVRNVPEGNNTFQIVTTDPAGNVTRTDYRWITAYKPEPVLELRILVPDEPVRANVPFPARAVVSNVGTATAEGVTFTTEPSGRVQVLAAQVLEERAAEMQAGKRCTVSGRKKVTCTIPALDARREQVIDMVMMSEVDGARVTMVAGVDALNAEPVTDAGTVRSVLGASAGRTVDGISRRPKIAAKAVAAKTEVPSGTVVPVMVTARVRDASALRLSYAMRQTSFMRMAAVPRRLTILRASGKTGASMLGPGLAKGRKRTVVFRVRISGPVGSKVRVRVVVGTPFGRSVTARTQHITITGKSGVAVTG